MIGLKVLKDKMLVRPIITKEKTTGGIIIPDAFRVTQNKGEVLVAGTGWMAADGRKIMSEAKVGDIVLYGAREGVEIEWKGEKLLILKEDQILGVEKANAARNQ